MQPRQVQQGSGEGSGECSRKPWCKAKPGSQQVAEKVLEKGVHGRTSDPLAVHVTPATQKRRGPNGIRGAPEGRQGVHLTPWQCTLCHACQAKAAETKGHQRDARGTPEGRQSVHPTPWQRTLCHACHAKGQAGGVSCLLPSRLLPPAFFRARLSSSEQSHLDIARFLVEAGPLSARRTKAAPAQGQDFTEKLLPCLAQEET